MNRSLGRSASVPDPPNAAARTPTTAGTAPGSTAATLVVLTGPAGASSSPAQSPSDDAVASARPPAPPRITTMNGAATVADVSGAHSRATSAAPPPPAPARLVVTTSLHTHHALHPGLHHNHAHHPYHVHPHAPLVPSLLSRGADVPVQSPDAIRAPPPPSAASPSVPFVSTASDLCDSPVATADGDDRDARAADALVSPARVVSSSSDASSGTGDAAPPLPVRVMSKLVQLSVKAKFKSLARGSSGGGVTPSDPAINATGTTPLLGTSVLTTALAAPVSNSGSGTRFTTPMAANARDRNATRSGSGDLLGDASKPAGASVPGPSAPPRARSRTGSFQSRSNSIRSRSASQRSTDLVQGGTGAGTGAGTATAEAQSTGTMLPAPGADLDQILEADLPHTSATATATPLAPPPANELSGVVNSLFGRRTAFDDPALRHFRPVVRRTRHAVYPAGAPVSPASTTSAAAAAAAKIAQSRSDTGRDGHLPFVPPSRPETPGSGTATPPVPDTTVVGPRRPVTAPGDLDGSGGMTKTSACSLPSSSRIVASREIKAAADLADTPEADEQLALARSKSFLRTQTMERPMRNAASRLMLGPVLSQSLSRAVLDPNIKLAAAMDDGGRRRSSSASILRHASVPVTTPSATGSASAAVGGGGGGNSAPGSSGLLHQLRASLSSVVKVRRSTSISGLRNSLRGIGEAAGAGSTQTGTPTGASGPVLANSAPTIPLPPAVQPLSNSSARRSGSLPSIPSLFDLTGASHPELGLGGVTGGVNGGAAAPVRVRDSGADDDANVFVPSPRWAALLGIPSLKFYPDLEKQYQMFYYLQNKSLFSWMLAQVMALFLANLVWSVVVESHSVVFLIWAPSLGLAVGLFTWIWLRYSRREADLAFANMLIGLALGLLLINNNLLREMCSAPGLFWDNVLHLNHLVLCGFVYWMLRAPFGYRTGLGILFTVLQILIDALGSCAFKTWASNALVYLAANTIGLYFAAVSEMHNRRSFLKTRVVYRQQAALTLAKAQSEALLRMVLPSKIISDLKRNVGVSTRTAAAGGGTGIGGASNSYKELHNVTILFADLVGFTTFSSKVSAKKLVVVLSDLFTEFDTVSDALGLEKIKVIGDCYHCCGGVPEPVQSEAEAAEWAYKSCMLAIEIIQGVARTARKIKYKLQVRVGIHTGSVRAGVIGWLKLKYDVWSADVDLASLMEQSATVNIPHLSNTSYQLLKHRENMRFAEAAPVTGDEGELIKTYNLAKFHYAKATEGQLANVAHPLASSAEDVVKTMAVGSHAPLRTQPSTSAGALAPDVAIKHARSTSADMLAGNLAGAASLAPIMFPGTAPDPKETSNHGKSGSAGSGGNGAGAMAGLELVLGASIGGAGVGGGGSPLDPFGAVDTGALDDQQETVRAQQALFKEIARDMTWTGSFRARDEERSYKYNYMEYYGTDMLRAMTLALGVKTITIFASILVLDHSMKSLAGDLTAVVIMTLMVLVLWPLYNRQMKVVAITGGGAGGIGASRGGASGLWNVDKQLDSTDSMVKASRWAKWHPNMLACFTLFLPLMGDLVRLTQVKSVRPSMQLASILLMIYCTTAFIGLRTRWFTVLAALFVPLSLCAYYFGLTSMLGTSPAMPGGQVTAAFLVIVVSLLMLVTTNSSMDTQIRRNFQMKRHVQAKVAEIRSLQADTERLLLNIFPLDVAQRLRQNPTLRIADAFEDVTVLFGYIVNLDALELSPQLALQLLNEMISDIDEVCTTHHVIKIKTIGTKYLAMTRDGQAETAVPHAVRMAEFAMEFRDTIFSYNEGVFAHMYCNPLIVRIGINCGPVVAGVIGSSKYTYDIWGDSVNVASRMESNCPDNLIHTSQAAYEHLREYYDMTARGPVFIKGKGMLETYFLNGRKDSAGAVHEPAPAAVASGQRAGDIGPAASARVARKRSAETGSAGPRHGKARPEPGDKVGAAAAPS
ncbi:Adenylate cyclase type 6 [Allomyces javanicus]|nr:Adenylate cyclase type 6 [Allomyces javanicus]